MIQQAADDAIQTDVSSIGASDSGVDNNAHSGSSEAASPSPGSGAHSARVLYESFDQELEDDSEVQREDAEHVEVAAKRNLSRARSAASSSPGASPTPPRGASPPSGFSARAASFQQAHAKLPSRSVPSDPSAHVETDLKI